MCSIGQLAKKFRLSRTTLLYYESIGLLKNSGRTPSGYRVYSESNCQLLDRICSYREAGLPLMSIKELLSGSDSMTVSLLEGRINELNQSILSLRAQQKGIVRLLLNYQAKKQKVLVDHNAWDEIFRAAGFSRYDQWQWHREFETASPEQHQLFLESVGAPTDKIAEIRKWAQSDFEMNSKTGHDRLASDRSP